MKIQLTIREIMDKGLWIALCELKQWNEWCLAEGLADENEIVSLSLDEYKKIGGRI